MIIMIIIMIIMIIIICFLVLQLIPPQTFAFAFSFPGTTIYRKKLTFFYLNINDCPHQRPYCLVLLFSV